MILTFLSVSAFGGKKWEEHPKHVLDPLFLPSIPGVHSQVVQQQPTEIKGGLGFSRRWWLLVGHPHATVQAAFQHELPFLGALSQQGLSNGTFLLSTHPTGRRRRLIQLALRVQEALGTAAPNPLQQLIQGILSLLHLGDIVLEKDMLLRIAGGGEGAGHAAVWQAALQRPIQDPAIPGVLPWDIPDDHPHVRGRRCWLSARLLLGRDLEVRDESAVIEHKQLQVGATEHFRAQLRGLHVRIVMVLAQEAVENGRAPTERVVAQVIHQVSHDHPRSERNQFQIPPPLLWNHQGEHNGSARAARGNTEGAPADFCHVAAACPMWPADTSSSRTDFQQLSKKSYLSCSFILLHYIHTAIRAGGWQSRKAKANQRCHCKAMLLHPWQVGRDFLDAQMVPSGQVHPSVIS